jgi:hypothetical protein
MTPLTTRLKKYRKTVVAATGLGLTFASTFFPDNKYTIAAIAVATAFGVWRVPNARTREIGQFGQAQIPPTPQASTTPNPRS